MGSAKRELAHNAVTVGTSTVAAAAANENRTYLLLINDSANTIWVKFGAAAVANEGIRLNANGGSFEMSSENGNLDTRACNALAGAINSELLVTEA